MAPRESFSGKLGFVIASAGAAVGLGNIWRFPFSVGDGGGAAFVIIYLFFCFLICFPVMLAEIAIGRKTQKNPVGAFNALGFRKWNVIGKLGVITNILILSFYNVIAAWAFGYFIELIQGSDLVHNFSEFSMDVGRVGVYSLVFMFLTAFVVSRGVSNGIEKSTRILMPALVVIILILAGYGMSLPHSSTGLAFYLIPDFSKVTIEVIGGALGQAFFSLGIGAGVLITYGSYISKKQDIVSSATLITLSDAAVAFLSGLMIFPLVTFMTEGSTEGISGGAGLIFNTLPQVFQSLGTIGLVVGPLFFLLLSFAALTSTVATLEVPVSYLMDERKYGRKKAVVIMSSIALVLSIPSILSNGYSDFFTNFISYVGASGSTGFMVFISNISGDTLLPLGGFLVVLFTVLTWKKNQLHQELSEGNEHYKHSFVHRYVDFSITYIAPFALGAIFLIKVLQVFFSINLNFN